VAASREIFVDWVWERGIVISRESPRGRTVACGADDFQVGPDSEADPSKWRTELAYLVVEDR